MEFSKIHMLIHPCILSFVWIRPERVVERCPNDTFLLPHYCGHWSFWTWNLLVAKLGCICKVEKILKGSLCSIPSPSPSVKIQLQESSLEVWRQNIAGRCQQAFCFQKFVDITQQCFALLPQVNSPNNNLNFHWRCRWCDRIQATF